MLGLKPLAAFGIAAGVLSLAAPNTLLTLASLAALFVIVALLWRPGEPPVLLLAMLYHWVQACVLTFDVNLRGLTLEEALHSPTIDRAAWYTLIGVLVVTCGIWFGAKQNTAPTTHAAVEANTVQFSIRRLAIGSFAAILLANAMTPLAFSVSALTQPILALANYHWVVVYLFTFTVLSRRRGYGALLALFLVELFIGFMGYFSGFKTVILIMLIAALATPNALKGLRFRMAAGLGAMVLGLALVWTAIKKDYRLFLNQGSGNQVVLVPVEQRVAKLRELVGGLTARKLGESMQALSERLTYVSYFGEVIQIVPGSIAHEGGKLWWEAVEHCLFPRFLNPDKRAINDSERTSFYTGGYVAGVQDGTSISLGYIAESYIDFGPVFMALPLFLWGWFLGWAFRVFVRYTPFPVLGYANATVLILLNAAALETSNVKMVAATVLGFAVQLLVQRTLGRWLLGQLSTSRKARMAGTHPAGA
jgi:hypothetical protein